MEQPTGTTFIGQDAPTLVGDQSQRGASCRVDDKTRLRVRLQVERIRKQGIARLAADEFMAANPVDETMCLDCRNRCHSRCYEISCQCCGADRKDVAA